MASLDADKGMVLAGQGSSSGPSSLAPSTSSKKPKRFEIKKWNAGALWTWGFNASVAGCFFAIETVLRPLRAENSPPFTTAMIILASVISSTERRQLLLSQHTN